MNENIRDFEIHGITGYTVMSNYHLRDPNLSLKAKGLLSMMLSMPKDWDYSIRGLAKISKEGRDAIKSILDELKESEYLKLEPKRDEKGHFMYKYLIYYLPYPKWVKMQNLSSTDFPYSVEPISDKSPQIKNKYKKDKLDKTPEETGEEIKHTIFTKELFKRNYISEDDSSSFLFDQLFEELLKEGNNYKDLLIMTNYVVSRIKERDFKDENDNEIKNKYGYFKNALISNIRRFNNMPENLYEEDEYDWLNDDNNSNYDWLNDNEEDLEL